MNSKLELNKGDKVYFKADGRPGMVVIGSTQRSLIQYTPDRGTGCSRARDWFLNKELTLTRPRKEA